MDPAAAPAGVTLPAAATRRCEPALEPDGWCWYQAFEEDRPDASPAAAEWIMLYVDASTGQVWGPLSTRADAFEAPRGYYLKVPGPEAIARLAFENRTGLKPAW